MTDDDIRAHVMKAEGVLDQIQDKVTSQFGDARKAIMAIDRAYSQLLDSRDFYREARNELITDRDHWEAQAKEARAQGVSDLIKRHWLENQVRNREAERDFLRAENAALRAGQGYWPEHDDSPAGEQVPRVITAAELIHGMWVAGKREDGTWTAGTVNGNSSIISRGGLWLGALEDFGHFILLEDAPTSEGDDDADQDDKPIYVGPQPPYSHAILPDGRIFSYDQAKHIKDGDPETKPAPRLTVHALNTAPVESNVSTPNKTWTKNHDGTWFRVTQFGQHTRTSEELLAAGYANATLTHPERGGYDAPTLSTDAKRFALVRDEDETGVSGTGKVAEGIIYSDDHVSMRWIVGEHRSTVAYDSITAVEAIHGHGGKTKVVIDHE